MPNIDRDGYWISCDFTIGPKQSDGSFTISASFYNKNGSNTINNIRLSCSLDNSTWTWVPEGGMSLGPHRSGSGTRTIYSGNTSSQTVYCYVLYGSSTSGPGGGYPVEGYVDPTPTFVKKTLNITSSLSNNPITQIMGQTLSIWDSGGTGVTSVNHTWSVSGTPFGSGDFDTGTWTVPTNQFEPLCPSSDRVTATFTSRSSGPGGSGSSSKSVTLIVPPDYVPTATHESVYINPRNNALVAGISSLRVELTPSLLPEGLNSASISGTELLSVSSTNPAITTSSFTKSGNNYTSGVLPTLANAPSYTFRLTFRITDSRGRTSDYTTGDYRVSNFVPPYCQITNLHRDTSTTGTLQVTITSPSAAYSAKVKVGNGTPVNVLSQLVPTQDGYTLTYHFSGLNSGEQYNVTFYYKDTNMYTYGEVDYAYSQLLSTMAMPLSLFDNGSRLAASFGEECADNYGEDVVINFAKDAYIRYINGNTAVIDKAEYIFNPCPFAIGGIYISTASANPDTIWPWTSWQAVGQGRVLIGVGTGTDANGDTLTVAGGDTDGEYAHTLTTSEMPSHTHTWYPGNTVYCLSDSTGTDEDVKESNLRNGQPTSSTGGDGAHNNVQPYLGVYMWERTA